MMTTKNVDPLSVSLGIITALPEEYAAVRHVFNCGREIDLPGTGAGRKYSIAKVETTTGSEHVIAIALLTDMGNNSSAIRATQMAHHFPNIEQFLMVGIAGAVPNPQNPDNHVRLGDIVVSDRHGVVQYDLDKEESDITIIRNLPRPPGATILEAVHSLAAGEVINQRPWQELIASAVAALGDQWSRPLENQDIFQDGPELEIYPHPSDPKRITGQPRVFHGPIASANKLLKNPKKRDALRDAFSVKAVEMEGSGIADSSWNLERGYLVVRGTCDYCNPGKGNVWRNYASIAAATYARCVIEVLPTSSRLVVRQNNTKQAATVDDIKRMHDVEQLNSIFHWLHVDVMNNFIDILGYSKVTLQGHYFYEGFESVVEGHGFHINDNKLKKLIYDFYRAWNACFTHIDLMDKNPNNILYFRMPLDLAVNEEQEAASVNVARAAEPLSRSFRSLLAYVQSNYTADIDITTTGKEALKHYIESNK